MRREEVVSAPTVTTFEDRLDKFWSKQDIKYDFEATLNVLQMLIDIVTADKQVQDLNIEV